ncbi:MAG: stage III sporulation protein AG [Oscillospiraceae bacterium]|jgi:stage III sporulation protein AG|nr:stage III sporulation protein AG [Oscillospiraceae bacterium]MCI1991184.1 stage III sporulation protein AG [Oscillospiraceae bacterium]
MAVEQNGGGQKGLFQKLAENDTYRKIILGAGLLGIALILLSGNLKSCDSQTAPTASSPSSRTVLTAEEYEKQMENSLSGIISQIDGVGNARVMVTLEQTSKSVYATQEKKSGQQTDEKAESGVGKNETNNSDETTYLLVKDADGSEKALQVTEVQPVVKGVVVVCDGGGDPKVQQNITDAVTTALHITSVRVCVIKAK